MNAILLSLSMLLFGDEPLSPLCLHPQNPHYFLFRGRPTVLITASEHYGAVMNREFPYIRYLDVLQSHGFNLTRTFSGTYREVPGSFGIKENTLAPASGQFLCPWGRSTMTGAADGGNKFDLTTWDADYFKRLKDFVQQAGQRGIVVELVLFCTFYEETMWSVSPMNVTNNINEIESVGRQDVFSGKYDELTKIQEALVRKLVTELNEFDNVYFEVCNEPYERPGLTRQWNDRMIAAIVDTESALPKRHLIAEGIAVRSATISNPNRNVSVFNFHAARPDAVSKNYGIERVIADDETGGGNADRDYRLEAWQFLLSGGAVFDHLDFSFTRARPDGTGAVKGAPGGGGPVLRGQLAVLKRFLEDFDFVRMRPNSAIVVGGVPDGAVCQVLMEPQRAYAIHVAGGTQANFVIDLPPGTYVAQWLNTKTGAIEKMESFEHRGERRTFASPAYMEDIALSIKSSPTRP